MSEATTHPTPSTCTPDALRGLLIRVVAHLGPPARDALRLAVLPPHEWELAMRGREESRAAIISDLLAALLSPAQRTPEVQRVRPLETYFDADDSEEFREGVRDRLEGKNGNANPYAYETPEHDDWHDGWSDDDIWFVIACDALSGAPTTPGAEGERVRLLEEFWAASVEHAQAAEAAHRTEDLPYDRADPEGAALRDAAERLRRASASLADLSSGEAAPMHQAPGSESESGDDASHGGASPTGETPEIVGEIADLLDEALYALQRARDEAGHRLFSSSRGDCANAVRRILLFRGSHREYHPLRARAFSGNVLAPPLSTQSRAWVERTVRGWDAMLRDAVAERFASGPADAIRWLADLVRERLGSVPAAPGAACHGCGMAYEDFWGDVVLPSAAWSRIAPKDGEGLLCPQCIMVRLAEVGTPDYPDGVPATIYPVRPPTVAERYAMYERTSRAPTPSGEAPAGAGEPEEAWWAQFGLSDADISRTPRPSTGETEVEP